MAYPPATKLWYNEIISSILNTNSAIVLTDNNVICISGYYKGRIMKLIDWLILAGGKEVVEESYQGEADKIWKQAQDKAGLQYNSNTSAEIDTLQKMVEENRSNIRNIIQEYAEDEYSKHY